MEITFEKILRRVTEIIGENLGIEADQIQPDSDLIDDLHADSLDILSITLAIRSKLDVSVNDEQMAQFRSAYKIAAALVDQMVSDGQPGRVAKVPQQV